MFNKSEQESSPLRALMQDISMPSCLVSESVTNVNMWMSASESKSSTHYDPYHNILCVVLGQKQVTLWPPSATPFLYPYPVYGEASNHSSVDFAKPDGAMHPLFNHAMKLCQVVMLEPGDALYIPEGWYHQVNSERLTIAVNFWWPSMVALALNSHMDGYYLRRIVSSLLECEKKKNVQLARLGRVSGEPTNAVAANGFKQSADLDDCNSILGQVEANMHHSELNGEKGGMGMPHSGRKDAFEMLTALQQHCLRTLVVTCSSDENSNVVAERTGIQHGESSRNPRYRGRLALAVLEMEHRKPADTMQEDNAVAHVLSILDLQALKQILLVMVEHFPRTLEVLVQKKLSPLAAELLTRRFDEMDTTFPESAQAEFYKAFFSVFEDQKAAMAALLDGKEAFSAAALTSVLEGYLGSSCPSSLSPPVDL